MPPPHDEKRSSTSTPPLKPPPPTPAATSTPAQPPPFTQSFASKETAAARAVYLKILVGGCFFIVITIFAIFAIFWGSLWKTPVRNLDGWIVDFDNALIGNSVKDALTMPLPQSKVTWTVVPADRFPGGTADVVKAVVDEKTWVALVVNSNATTRLTASYATPDRTYNGSHAITVYAAEARNENAFRSIINPSVQSTLVVLGMRFAQQAAGTLLAGNAGNVTSILATSPQTVLAPLGFTVQNLLPFNRPVASAVTFVGLIYQLILSFFIVMISLAARDASGFSRSLTFRSLVALRLGSAFVAYFFISLFYALLSVAFQLDFTQRFGRAGFVIFWMLNWAGMLSVGLALESLITLLTVRFIPFFLITWIIVNVSVCIFPIEVMPVLFRYGYATPFYNVSHAVRCIVFGTKNTVGENFGILIAWTAISCITLPLVQWVVRRGEVRAQAPGANRGAEGGAGAGADVRAENGKSERDTDKLGLPEGEGQGEEGAVLASGRSRSRSRSPSLSGSRTPGRRSGEGV